MLFVTQNQKDFFKYFSMPSRPRVIATQMIFRLTPSARARSALLIADLCSGLPKQHRRVSSAGAVGFRIAPNIACGEAASLAQAACRQLISRCQSPPDCQPADH